MNKKYYIYIITNYKKTVLYVGVTSNLGRRMYEHYHEIYGGFSKKYKTKYLVYYEVFNFIEEAILREKYLKGKTRKVKLALIESSNPDWKDLSAQIV